MNINLTKQINNLKLKPEEVIQCKNLDEDYLVRRHLAYLGVYDFADGYSVSLESGWNSSNDSIRVTGHDFNEVIYINSDDAEVKITAIEWLNRHGIFVPYQEVLVSEDPLLILNSSCAKRIWVAGNYCLIPTCKVSDLKEGQPCLAPWSSVKSPYSEWKPLSEDVYLVYNPETSEIFKTLDPDAADVEVSTLREFLRYRLNSGAKKTSVGIKIEEGDIEDARNTLFEIADELGDL